MSRALKYTIIMMLGVAGLFLLVGIVFCALLWLGLGVVLSFFITLAIAAFTLISIGLYFD